MERCFRFTVPLLIGAMFLSAAGILISSSAVRCGGYPTDPKFCFQKDDAATTSAQTTTNELESGNTNSHQKFPLTSNKNKNVSAATSIHVTSTVQDSEQSAPMDESNDVSFGQTMCSQNSACDNLGLQGECCPTTAGVYLGCCSPSNTKHQEKTTTANNAPPSNKGMPYEINPASSSSSSSCALNLNCHSLGLIGDCCPTSKGIQLSCCHS